MSLITLSDIKEFKGISSHINEPRDLEPHILEAQEFDLRPFLNESFYIDLVDDATNSPAFDKYSDLFNGKIYEYGGRKYEHQGIKAILAYHTYARFLSQASIKSTPHGMVHKNNPHSERVSDKALSRLIEQARSGAREHENRVLCYLNRFPQLFPLWECTNRKKYSNGKRIRKI